MNSYFSSFDSLSDDTPIEPTSPDVPLKAQEKWKRRANPDRLVKTFEFFDVAQRNKFVNMLFSLEELVQHRAQITISKDGSHVRVTVFTPEAGVLTDLDFEYARDADDMYNDSYSVYSQCDEY